MVEEAYDYIYDGSFEGFLSVIFAIYERKVWPSNIYRNASEAHQLFAKILEVESNTSYAKRVSKAICEKGGKQMLTNIYRCFLSEDSRVEMYLFELIREVLKSNAQIFKNYANENTLKIHQILKQIRREVHRMHAFVRFQELKDGSYAAVVNPDFNVLPLIGSHFENRYPTMEWLIYDTRRKYGIHYKSYKTEFIEFEEHLAEIPIHSLSTDEVEYQKMWKKYFESVNIKERNNNKLHLRHVPRRYWTNLIEK